jgi:hypothetical protein
VKDLSNEDLPTIYAPAVWRRIAEADRMPDAQFPAEYLERAQLDSPVDAALRAQLAQLAERLYDLLIDRVDRLITLCKLVPEAQNERDALTRAGLSWGDTGLPESFDPKSECWLPLELPDANWLLTWLEANPPELSRSQEDVSTPPLSG